MSNLLPATPADVLQISSRARRLRITIAGMLARIVGFWDRPMERAATSFEEMTELDGNYWIYKSANPVTKPEKGWSATDFNNAENLDLRLPNDFEKSASLTISAAGDLFQADGLEHSKDTLYENVSGLLFETDISYANFESPVTHQELKKEIISDKVPPIECCSLDQFTVLAQHKGKKFNVLHTANNHILDMGVEGIETTQRAFAEAGILDLGTNGTPDDFGIGKIIVKEGIKVGFASATFGLNGHILPAGQEYRIHASKLLSKYADTDLSLLKLQIDDCKNRGCDFIIASIHWGYEFEFFPRKRQIEAAHALVEYGADAILSHHPHVIQPVEFYRTQRDPDRVAVIAYSLGSLTWGFTAPHIVLSLIINLKLSKGSLHGRQTTYIDQVYVTPVFRSVVNEEGEMITRIQQLADNCHGQSADHPGDYVARIYHYAQLVLGSQVCATK